MTQLRCMKYIIRHEREGAVSRRKPGKCAASSTSDTRIRGGQWGEIPDINEPVSRARPLSRVSTCPHQTQWPFMLTDDFITQVMSGLPADNGGETLKSSFPSWKENCLICRTICFPLCIRDPCICGTFWMSDDEIILRNDGGEFVNCPILVVSPSLRERSGERADAGWQGWPYIKLRGAFKR